MGDELGTPNQTENLAASGQSEAAVPVAPKRVALPPRPVSVPPRPANTSLLPPRPPGSSAPVAQRGLSTPLPHLGQQPPPPPLRSSLGVSAPPNAPSSAPPLPPSVPPAPAPSSNVPAPSTAIPNGLGRDAERIQSLLAELMGARQELTETAAELRKVAAERDALRTRVAAAEAKTLELSSAFSAEAQLRAAAAETHAATSSTLRARIAELETALSESRKAAPEPAGLRRIRGIGPAYERALLGLGITTVAQIAQLSPEDIARIAPQIKAQAERITRDDWVGQARRLLGQ